MDFLQKQVVLITGCSSGIGHALAMEFTRRGHRVFATARRLEAVDDLRREGFEALALDVTKHDAVELAVDGVIKAAGRIDIVVNNAGFGLMGPVAETPMADIRREFETNVLAVAQMAQAVAPQMIKQAHGRIVSIGSISSRMVTPFAGVYCASKAALHAMSRAMDMELRPLGVRSICIQTGAVKSNFGEAAADGLQRYENEVSHYAPVAKYIAMRAKMSQRDPMPAEEYAKEVVTIATSENPASIVNAGKGVEGLEKWLAENTLEQQETQLMKNFGLREWMDSRAGQLQDTGAKGHE